MRYHLECPKCRDDGVIADNLRYNPPDKGAAITDATYVCNRCGTDHKVLHLVIVPEDSTEEVGILCKCGHLEYRHKQHGKKRCTACYCTEFREWV